MTVRKFSSPLRILEYTRKKKCYTKAGKLKPMQAWVMLNMNVWQVIVAKTPFRRNNIKRIYFDQMKSAIKQIEPVPKGVQVGILFTVWQEARRLCDVSNYAIVADKIGCDALVEHGILTDDNWTVVPKVFYQYGGVDKKNPRVDIEIFEIGKSTDVKGQFCFDFKEEDGPFK